MSTDYVTLVGLFEDHSGLVNTLWGILQVVTLGLLGFVYKEEYVRRNPRILALLSLAFVGFALGNQKAILRSQAVLRAVYEQLHDPQYLATVPASLRGVLAAHQAATVAEIRQDHWILVVSVVVAVWLPYAFDRARGRSGAA